MSTNVTRTQGIANFLKAATHSDLAELYSHNMECQVNVAQDGGERVTDTYQGRQWHGWTDHMQTWKSFRIPRNAHTVPEYTDSKLTFSLEQHAEGIGMTGWDWVHRVSRWVAFDFDAISGHKEGHEKRLSDEELENVKTICTSIPWVTVRKSASGKGLHIYVFLNPVATQNHNEHAALARAVLGKMAALTGFDFQSKVDVCGQNMWVWHRKMKGTDGLTLIKQGNPLSDIPPNWRDHIRVISGHRKKNLPAFIEQVEGQTESERIFLELMGQVTHTPLDDSHKRLIRYLEDKGTQSWWDADHHILITHTSYLKDAHTELNLKGIFDTLAKGTEAPNDHNCFMHPLRDGAWAVRRYSMGVAEHQSWDQDGKGYTRCYFNRNPDLASAARSKGAVESPSGGFVFAETEIAAEVATILGATIQKIPVGLRTQKATLKRHKDGRLLMQIEGDKEGIAAHEMQGWLHERGKYTRIFTMNTPEASEVEAPNMDGMIRHVITEAGEEYGWLLKGEAENEWHRKDLTHVKIVLESLGVLKPDLSGVLGNAVVKCWKLVSRPFQPEYIGNRLWNRGAAQLRFIPSQSDDLKWHTWDKILTHCGKGLDDALKHNAWAKANGVMSGKEYLMIWLASLIKEPLEPLPYLFFYGSQDCGKSIFHEAASLLFRPGYQRADNALINPQGFNGEIEHAVMCVVEEINLRKNAQAGNRIKDWVTARQLPIHKKGKTPYHVSNTTHWIQCANESTACPTFPGDTRITMIHVPQLNVGDKIPKRFMLPDAEREAADFLGMLMSIEIPASNDRLNVPMIATAEKIEAENANRTPLEAFIAEKCFYAPGKMILFADFYDTFIRHTDADDVVSWSKIRVGRELPAEHPRGRDPKTGSVNVGNISWSPVTEDELKQPKLKVTVDGAKNTFLVPENEA